MRAVDMHFDYDAAFGEPPWSHTKGCCSTVWAATRRYLCAATGLSWPGALLRRCWRAGRPTRPPISQTTPPAPGARPPPISCSIAATLAERLTAGRPTTDRRPTTDDRLPTTIGSTPINGHIARRDDPLVISNVGVASPGYVGIQCGSVYIVAGVCDTPLRHAVTLHYLDDQASNANIET